MKITIIAAIHTTTRGLGTEGRLLWDLVVHQRYLEELTRDGVVIVGRKTYESLLLEDRGVCDRINLVLTEQDAFVYLESRNIIGVYSIDDAEERARHFLREEDQEVFVIGGQEVFELFLPLASKLHLTLVNGEVSGCDKFFPVYREHFDFMFQHGLGSLYEGLHYCFTTWERKKE